MGVLLPEEEYESRWRRMKPRRSFIKTKPQRCTPDTGWQRTEDAMKDNWLRICTRRWVVGRGEAAKDKKDGWRWRSKEEVRGQRNSGIGWRVWDLRVICSEHGRELLGSQTHFSQLKVLVFSFLFFLLSDSSLVILQDPIGMQSQNFVALGETIATKFCYESKYVAIALICYEAIFL